MYDFVRQDVNLSPSAALQKPDRSSIDDQLDAAPQYCPLAHGAWLGRGVERKMLGRAIKQLRDKAAESFFQKRGGRKGGTILTADKLALAQELFNQGYEGEEVSVELGVKKDTLGKALGDGRLSEQVAVPITASTCSERTEVDAQGADGMGIACTDTLERVSTAIGRIDGVESRFEKCLDVPMGAKILFDFHRGFVAQ